jgi:hypothetical protein
MSFSKKQHYVFSTLMSAHCEPNISNISSYYNTVILPRQMNSKFQSPNTAVANSEYSSNYPHKSTKSESDTKHQRQNPTQHPFIPPASTSTEPDYDPLCSQPKPKPYRTSHFFTPTFPHPFETPSRCMLRPSPYRSLLSSLHKLPPRRRPQKNAGRKPGKQRLQQQQRRPCRLE